MKRKNEAIIEIRGKSIETIFDNSSTEEKFQNQTLRPILKFQNDLLIEVFRNYACKQKNVFFSLTPEKKMIYIDKVIQRDIKFRNLIKGIIIGFFTISEYKDYIQNSSKINKRMMNLLIERLKNQLQII